MRAPGIRYQPTGESRREFLANKFNLTVSQRRHLTLALVEQLENCKSDEARMVLLGISGDILRDEAKNLEN